MPGPPPTSTRQPTRGIGYRPLVVLPSTGREGAAPRWPLKGRAPRQWRPLWSTPQAVVWEELHIERTVARYVQLLATVEDNVEATAAKHAQLTQLEDRLGLTPKGMLSLRWAVATTAPDVTLDDLDDEVEAGTDPERPDELTPDELDGGAEVTRIDRYRELYGS